MLKYSQKLLRMTYGTEVTPPMAWAAKEFSRASRPGYNKLFVLITDGQLYDGDVETSREYAGHMAAEGVLRLAVALPMAEIENMASLVDAVVDLRARPSALASVLSRTVRRALKGRGLRR